MYYTRYETEKHQSTGGGSTRISSRKKEENEKLDKTLIAIATQKDAILQQVIKWKGLDSYPTRINAMIAGNKGLRAYYNKYHSIKIITLENNLKYLILREEQNLRERICLPLTLILLAFEKAHGPISGHFGFEKTFIL